MKGRETMKRYQINPKIGTVKHSISFYDGIKTHKDGSDFYALAVFKTKKELIRKEKELIAMGYIQE